MRVFQRKVLKCFKYNIYNEVFSLLYQGRMAPIPMQRPLEVSPAERAAPIRHVPTQL